MGNKRGTIAFFATYRSPVPLDIFACHVSSPGPRKEVPMTDGKSYNYNGQAIPPGALKAIIQRPKTASLGCTDSDVDSGRLSGMIFVSERDSGLELLHIALTFNGKVTIFSFAEIYGISGEVRMEDSPCFAGEYLVYISTVQPALERRQPWTAVYKTNLRTGETDRLTPREEADLSPSVSPSGKRIAVASFEGKGGWEGEIKGLKTDIYVMDIDDPDDRTLVVNNGGWPSWGSDDVIFFHRADEKGTFGVYRADIGDAYESGIPIDEAPRVTPAGMEAMTPAAIDTSTVAVAIIRKWSCISKASEGREDMQYRHVEIFEFSPTRPQQTSIQVTQAITPKADHFNPFVIDAGKRIIGYHRCSINDHLMNGGHIEKKLHNLASPQHGVEVIRTPGVFPTFSSDGSKFAFVDNEFKAVWVADDHGLRVVFNAPDKDSVFSTVWCQNPNTDTLYVCMGPSFKADQELHIHAIPQVSKRKKIQIPLTEGDSNNAFPSTNKDGTMIVFRSTRDGGKGKKRYKSLYLMDSKGRNVRRLTTKENCTDTHCMWSPTGDWIVFSSDRDKPAGAPATDNELDPGYFSVFLVNWRKPDVIVRIMQSGRDIAGHINHPVFSPDGKSIVITADLAAVSVDPISMALVTHSVRPYGDIFTFDIDPNNITNNYMIKKFTRITHSRYENALATWTTFSLVDRASAVNLDFKGSYEPVCPYLHPDGGQSWHMSGHLCVPKCFC